MNQSSKNGTSLAERKEVLLIKENSSPSGTYLTQSGSARVSRVGECADQRYAWALFVRNKNRTR